MRLTLRVKTRLLFCIATVGFGAFGALMLDRLAHVTAVSTEIAEQLMPLSRIAGEVRFDVVDFRLHEARHLGFTRPEDLDAEERLIRRQTLAVAADLAAYAKLLPPAEDHSAITRLQAEWQRFVDGETAMLAASRANRKDEALRLYTDSAARMAAFRPQTEELFATITRRTEAASHDAKGVFASAYNLVLALFAAGLLAGLACALYFERAVTRAILRLAGCMQRLTDGELATEIPLTARHDEIGIMARTVETFKENAVAMRGMEATAEELLRAGEAERAEAERERQAKLTRQAILVDAMMSGLQHLAEGNLNFSLTTPFSPAVDKLRQSYNETAQTLLAVVGAIVERGQTVGEVSGKLPEAAEFLAATTRSQAEALDQARASLQQIAATVQQAASGAEQARAQAARTKAQTESSGRIVGEAVAAMGDIEDSARQIGNIIGLIEDIAFQTNLLALNAGVEAARAGETGRGFAVVATEVRALAQRSATAAKEIKTLISTSMQQVERGVRLVGDAGQALGRIQSGVIEINASIGEIARSGGEQSAGLQDVAQALSGMDDLARRHSAAMAETMSAIQSLSQESQDLLHRLDHFKIADAPFEYRTVA